MLFGVKTFGFLQKKADSSYRDPLALSAPIQRVLAVAGAMCVSTRNLTSVMKWKAVKCYWPKQVPLKSVTIVDHARTPMEQKE